MVNRIAPVVFAASMLAASCTPGGEHLADRLTSTTTTAPDSSSSTPEAGFQTHPNARFDIIDCWTSPDVVAEYIDYDPTDTPTPPDDVFTLGIDDFYDEKGRPVLETGATIRSLGNFAYEVSAATSDTTQVVERVDLRQMGINLLLQSRDGRKDGVLSGRLDEQNRAHFVIGCLPTADLDNNGEPDPPPAPTIPSPDLPPTPTTMIA